MGKLFDKYFEMSAYSLFVRTLIYIIIRPVPQLLADILKSKLYGFETTIVYMATMFIIFVISNLLLTTQIIIASALYIKAGVNTEEPLFTISELQKGED